MSTGLQWRGQWVSCRVGPSGGPITGLVGYQASTLLIVTVTPRLRDQQRAASEAAILDAAWARFAKTGPDGTSLRDVASDAGCTHALVARYFGSKDGLVEVVGDRLAERVNTTVGDVESSASDPLLGLLSAARQHRSSVQLLVRCALGDMQPTGFPACLRAEWVLAATQESGASSGARADRRARLCAYAASSLLLGWLTFEEFLVAATRLGRVGPRRSDAAVADAAGQLMALAAGPEPKFVARDRSGPGVPGGPLESVPATARDALLQSAIELFAELGPASVSVRDVARHAGVNQGLIYRHFGSKEALLAEAIEQGSSDLFPAARAAAGFDFDAMSQLMHHGSTAPRLIARTLVDDIDISTVRGEFPVLRRLLDGFGHVPTGSRPGDLSDPRIAVATAAGMALGSVIWGGHLRRAFGLTRDDGIEAAIADLARVVVGWPAQTAVSRGAGP